MAVGRRLGGLKGVVCGMQVSEELERKLAMLTREHPDGILGSQISGLFMQKHGHQIKYKEEGFAKLSSLFAASKVVEFVRDSSSGMLFPAGEMCSNVTQPQTLNPKP